MTIVELIAAFRTMSDDDTQPYLWSDNEITLYLKDAEMEAVSRARLIIESSGATYCEIALVNGTHTYDLNPLVLEVLRCKVGTALLARMDGDGLDTELPGWDDLTGAPKYYHLVGQKIRVAPTPTTSSTLKITVSRLPISMASTGPEIHARFHLRLLDWVLHLAYQKRDSDACSRCWR